MPRIESEQLGVAFDLQGCPNRCRHCWLGPSGPRTLSEADVRRTAARLRELVAGRRTPVRRLAVSTWFREPDFSDDYRRLHDLEAELSDGKPCRYELLSVWRLARDEGYADWARSVGPDTCQISFFGTEATNDWFHRRRGAFRDALVATERLLRAGMKPRWQVFLTTKLLPDLPALLGTVDRLRLRERVEALGGEFGLFLHPPGPEGEADAVPGLDVLSRRSPAELARAHGDPDGRRVYSGAEDLLSLYRARHCEREWTGGGRPAGIPAP